MKKLKNYLIPLCLVLSVTTLFAQQDVDTESSQRDNVVIDDSIIIGSQCVGLDCVDGENFGFDTIRLKENNLMIHFDDTSNSGSFPSNDWRIAINDSSNGGLNYFGIDDATAGTNPFRILAGAGNNAFYLNASGNLGLGTATPALELQITDGDTPAMRLEQDNTIGWGAQTWDVAGNEANFFIRDVTNGSLLPFRIQPGAATSSLYIASTGYVSLGDTTPSEKLEVNGNAAITGNSYIAGQAGIATITPDANASLDLAATDKALLLNRLTTAGRADLTTAGAVAGMLVYDTDDNKTYYFNGTEWVDPSSDNQNLASASLADTTLTIAIENGTSVDVDLAPILTPLQEAITDLENENAAQQAQIDALMARMDAVEACACGGTLSIHDNSDSLNESESIRLNQNTPNPFNAVTTIDYFIPVQYTSANIQVVSSLGQVVYDIPITQFGEGSVTLTKNNLQSAVYFYTLYVDGKKIASKRLVVD
ncbi:T9SS type A sorting domain-containing protein [Lacinutrix sp. C3R15]|uniref:T9SS type A sorting domain-containing protein n=1 Tax=Flavobacteriaceae TaxID=49546 RepID=UPI001C0A0E25|nr:MULTISPECIES: T9SS type A sorting domain-containing protein [Flavobacteriaceae]MBU2940593.1 T9SS type A sorting domain-containing protein [Lacinutrix sp. C3R15]MDO6623911.1 T9SS type A sorting domain-containing protein [Oceanihabitans sp. 1_MG-2023]